MFTLLKLNLVNFEVRERLVLLVKHFDFVSEVAESLDSFDVHELEGVQDGGLVLMFRCKQS